MSLQDTLDEIDNTFAQWAAGRPGDSLVQVYLEQLAKQFGQLKVDLAATPGWSAATGTATRTTFDTATVTLPQLAERVKAMIDDDLAKGRSSA